MGEADDYRRNRVDPGAGASRGLDVIFRPALVAVLTYLVLSVVILAIPGLSKETTVIAISVVGLVVGIGGLVLGVAYLARLKRKDHG